jgi:Flp pilus assembly protein CpaB
MPTATQLPPSGPKGQNGPSPGSRRQRLLGTRRGAIAVAVVAGLAALAVLLVFMANFRNSVRNDSASVRVLVAGRQLDPGTSGEAIAEAGLYRAINVRGDEAAEGAFHDPAALNGTHTTATIHVGQQLTASDFASGSDPIAGKLTGTERALAVPVDAAHGNIGQVKPGSRVDVMGGITDVAVLARNALVLAAPEKPKSGVATTKEQDVVIRVSDVEAQRIAFVADEKDVWLAIRPPTLAKDSGGSR